MSARRAGAAGATGGAARPRDFHADGTSDIAGPPGIDLPRPVLHADLSPGERDASLATSEPDSALAPLTAFLGTALTVGSRAWGRGALHDMRMLQKTLVAASLKEEGAARADCLAALMVVERNVSWRLRIQQMAMDGVEGVDGAARVPGEP